jgi:hypothetical protein
MEESGIWEKLLIGLFTLLLLVFLVPRAGTALKMNRRGSAQEWLNVVVIFALVAVFVIALMRLS